METASDANSAPNPNDDAPRRSSLLFCPRPLSGPNVSGFSPTQKNTTRLDSNGRLPSYGQLSTVQAGTQDNRAAIPAPPSSSFSAPLLRHSCEGRNPEGRGHGGAPHPQPLQRHNPLTRPPSPHASPLATLPPCNATSPTPTPPHPPRHAVPRRMPRIEERVRFGPQQQGLVIPRHKNFSTCSCNATPQLQIRIPGGSPPATTGHRTNRLSRTQKRRERQSQREIAEEEAQPPTVEVELEAGASNWEEVWWAGEDSNFRPQLYQSCALTN